MKTVFIILGVLAIAIQTSYGVSIVRKRNIRSPKKRNNFKTVISHLEESEIPMHMPNDL